MNNTNDQGNYSYQDVQFFTTNVASIKVTGVSGAGWGFAGVLVNCPLHAIQSESFIEIGLSPNPTTGKINIRGTFPENAEVAIINELGKTIRKTKFAEGSIDITDGAPGLYSLIITVKEQTTVKRIIKL